MEPNATQDADPSGAAPEPGARRSRRSVARALLWPLSAFGFAALAHSAPGAVETLYSQRAYPVLARWIGRPARAWADSVGDGPALVDARASLGEITLVLAVVAAAWALLRALRGGLRLFLRRALVLTGVAAWAFLLAWGLNYAREPVAARLGLEPDAPRATVLLDMATTYNARLADALDALGPDWAEGVDFGLEAAQAWERAGSAEPALGDVRRPVVVSPLASSLLAAGGISGIFGPFTQEAHVVAGLVPIDQGFGACHELAHLAGWAREDEANYLAYRVAVRHGSPELAVAGWAGALRHTLRALKRADPAGWKAAVLTLDERVVALFERRRVQWESRRRDSVARVATRVNDAYLKSNAQGDGVGSYGRMVELLAAEFRMDDVPPGPAERRVR